MDGPADQAEYIPTMIWIINYYLWYCLLCDTNIIKYQGFKKQQSNLVKISTRSMLFFALHRIVDLYKTLEKLLNWSLGLCLGQITPFRF